MIMLFIVCECLFVPGLPVATFIVHILTVLRARAQCPTMVLNNLYFNLVFVFMCFALKETFSHRSYMYQCIITITNSQPRQARTPAHRYS